MTEPTHYEAELTINGKTFPVTFYSAQALRPRCPFCGAEFTGPTSREAFAALSDHELQCTREAK